MNVLLFFDILSGIILIFLGLTIIAGTIHVRGGGNLKFGTYEGVASCMFVLAFVYALTRLIS